MKREVFAHLISFIVIFAAVSVFRLMSVINEGLYIPFALFWLGGLIGTFLPDIDHLVYVYLLKPHELTSQRAANLIDQRQITQSANLLVSTQNERQNMIFHTIWFQVVFMGLTVWVMMSNTNLFGWGLVLAFSLHLLVDQIQDYRKFGSLDNWFNSTKLGLTGQSQRLYLLAIAGILFFLAFLT